MHQILWKKSTDLGLDLNVNFSNLLYYYTISLNVGQNKLVCANIYLVNCDTFDCAGISYTV